MLQGFSTFPSVGLSSFQAWPAMQSINIRSTNMSVSAATYLVNSSLPQLRHLSLTYAPFSLQVAEKLSQSNWPQLETLRLWGSVKTAQTLQYIAKGQWPMLDSLNVGRQLRDPRKYFQMADFSSVELDPLRSSSWPLLQSLEALGWNCIHLSEGQQACKWPELTSLTVSHISAHEQAPKALRYLDLRAVSREDSLLNALSMDLPALEELYVSLCPQETLASSPHLAANLVFQGLWPALEHLRLPNQRVGLVSMVPATHTGWTRLQDLDLSANYLHEESIHCLVACTWPSLTSLDLADNELDANAIQALINGDWPLLQHLCLCKNDLCEEACHFLTRGAWPRLTTLDVGYCGLDLWCLYQLLKGCWPGLERLNLDGNNLEVQEVYRVAQDIADQVTACKFAGLLTGGGWFEECELFRSDADMLANVSLDIDW